MAQMEDLYYKYYSEHNYLKLAHLSKLTQEQINIKYNYNIFIELFFYLYYGHYNKLDDYTNDFLADYITTTVRFNKIKPIKYFESRGINFGVDEYYLKAASSGAIKTMKYLESLGVNIHIKDNYMNNAYLSAPPNLKVLPYIESRGINIYHKNSYGFNYPLISIFNNVNIKIIKYFESKGFNINIIDNMMGAHIYMYAAHKTNIKMLKYLESKGNFINFQCKNKYNAFSVAFNNKNPAKIAKYLKSRVINIYKKNKYNRSLLKIFNNRPKICIILKTFYICSKTKYLLCYI